MTDGEPWDIPRAPQHVDSSLAMLVDTHHHFWNLEREAQSWMTEEHAVIRRTFEPPILLRSSSESESNGPSLFKSGCSDLDTDFMFEHAAQHSWIGGVIAWLDLRSPDRAARRLEQLRAEPRLRGFRHLIKNGPPALDTPGHGAGEPRLPRGDGHDPRAAVRLSASPRRRARARRKSPGPDYRDRPSCQAAARRDEMGAWAARCTPQPRTRMSLRRSPA